MINDLLLLGLVLSWAEQVLSKEVLCLSLQRTNYRMTEKISTKTSIIQSYLSLLWSVWASVLKLVTKLKKKHNVMFCIENQNPAMSCTFGSL